MTTTGIKVMMVIIVNPTPAHKSVSYGKPRQNFPMMNLNILNKG